MHACTPRLSIDRPHRSIDLLGLCVNRDIDRRPRSPWLAAGLTEFLVQSEVSPHRKRQYPLTDLTARQLHHPHPQAASPQKKHAGPGGPLDDGSGADPPRSSAPGTRIPPCGVLRPCSVLFLAPAAAAARYACIWMIRMNVLRANRTHARRHRRANPRPNLPTQTNMAATTVAQPQPSPLRRCRFTLGAASDSHTDVGGAAGAAASGADDEEEEEEELIPGKMKVGLCEDTCGTRLRDGGGVAASGPPSLPPINPSPNTR